MLTNEIVTSLGASLNDGEGVSGYIALFLSDLNLLILGYHAMFQVPPGSPTKLRHDYIRVP